MSGRVMFRSPQEAAFFKLVNKELQKMTQFFCSVEAQMLGRLGHVREGMKLIDMDTVLGKDEASWRHLLAACIKLYKDLLRLENYAIVAWTSVSKILKKHDKWTGKLWRLCGCSIIPPKLQLVRSLYCRVLHEAPVHAECRQQASVYALPQNCRDA